MRIGEMTGTAVLAALALSIPAGQSPAAAAKTDGTRKADVKMELTPQAVEQRISKHRTAEVTLTVADAAGKPLANQSVSVRQVAHKFLFGCNAFAVSPGDDSQLQRDYRRRYAELLNYATLPFYWGAYEPERDRTGFERVKAMAEWCKANGIRTKGHPLCWHEVPPRWAATMPVEQVHKLQIERIGRDVRNFAGLIDVWDVVNEAVVMPSYNRGGEPNPIGAVCNRIGRLELLRQAFAAAVEANAAATLLLNDYDTSPGYEELLDQCLRAGIRIDVIGIQSHQHGGYWGAEKTWDVCQRFARFGKPLHFTETTIISADRKPNQRWSGPAYTDWPSTPEGERRQAEQVAEFYTVLFSHPAVQAITWWDFSDHRAWLGAPSGLLRKDMSPKPAYERLMKLVKGDWWTGERTLTTDGAGKVSFRGFLGRYAVEAPSGRAQFALDAAGQLAVSVRLAPAAK